VAAAPGIPAGARPVGRVPDAATVSGEVVLAPRDNDAITRFIARVTDKSSPAFGAYLRPGAYAARFGPTASAISAVRSRLSGAGLRLSRMSGDDLVFHFTGTARAIRAAFGTGLESYRLADGALGRATTSAVSLPASIAGSVTAVLGLDALVKIAPIGALSAPATAKGKSKSKSKTRAPKTARFAHPKGSPDACRAATQAAGVNGGLTDDQIAHAYGAFGLYGEGDFGQGQHIALYELEPFARSDVRAFDTCYFGAAAAKKMLSRLHVVKVDGGQPAGPGSGESILDIEDLSAIAPGATIDVYEGPSPGANGTDYDPVDNYVAMVDSDTDQIVSSSWGLCEQAIEAGQPGLQQAENLLFEQAAAQGQSVFAAAGDNGSDDCNTSESPTPVAGQNPVSVDDPGSQPYVVSVGGTAIDDAASEPPVEQVWNDGPDGGAGGGGISQTWAMPAWQRESSVPGIALPTSADYTSANKVEKSYGYPENFCGPAVAGPGVLASCRLVPDVSAQADEFTGAVTVYQSGWGTSGGTSSATPIWAATLALVNASPTCASQPATRRGVGFASPLLYGVASSPSEYRASFNDITDGNNDLYGLDDSRVFAAARGYDLASGLGSPRLSGPAGQAGLAYYLCATARQEQRPVVSSLSPASGSTSGGEQLTITGSGFRSGGTSEVAAIQVGTDRLAAARFTVRSATTITVTMPPARDTRPRLSPAPQDGAGPAAVIVTLTGDRSSRPAPASIFEYTDTSASGDVPSVTGVVPYAGPETAPGKVVIMGSGFTGVTSVSFGGVKARSFTVSGHYRITATPPAYSHQTSCAPLPRTGIFAGENASNDICQVQVQVTSARGASALGRIRPPAEGAVTINALGALVAPAGCQCETMQAPTEYDYVPAPVVTSVSTHGAVNLASENGGTVITVRGRGLDPLTLNWADFGSPASEDSQATGYVFVTGTELQISSPPENPTTSPLKVPFSINSLAGQSRSITVTYAGLPAVTGIVNLRNRISLHGHDGAADSGGTPVEVTGKGFAGQLITPLVFSDAGSTTLGTQYSYTVTSATRLRTQTVAQLPGLVYVRVCTVTGCGASRAAQLYLYPPGRPHASAVSPGTGPAGGGTAVTVSGANLGCPLYVFFGKAKAKKVSPQPTFDTCGSTIALNATSPPGKAGSKVSVSVETIESYFTGAGHGTTTARFTYK
jgi:hypothetical protein